MNEQFKAAVTVAEMARMIGLSRSRFYQLIGNAMPTPNRDEHGRPYYNAEQQRTILEVRRRNFGIDGKPVLFYAPRHSAPSAITKRRTTKKRNGGQHDEIAEVVKALGLTTATVPQVEAEIVKLFPGGIVGVDHGEVAKKVYLSIKRQNSSDNVGR